MKKRRLGKFVVFLLIVTLVLQMLPTAYAQDEVVVGQDKVGEISVVNPSPSYIFNAQANQQVTIRVSAVASPVVPQFTIFNGNGVLVQAVGNPTLSNSVEGIVTFALAGVYNIQVSSADGSAGQFVLSVLSTQPAIPPTPLLPNRPVEGTLASGENLVYSFAGDPNYNLLLTLESLDDVQSVSSELTIETGESLATLSSLFLSSQLLIPAGSNNYLFKLNNPSLEPVGYRVSLTIIQPVTQDGQAIELIALPTTGACVLATRSAGNVNVRQDPLPDAPILTTISYTQSYPVIGKNSDSSWYQINYGSGTGWVAGSVTRRGGDCSAVAVTSTTTAPTQSATQTTTGTPTATQDPAPVTTPDVTDEAPETQAQIATDNDQSIEINIKNDNRTVSGAISYPEGDTQDTVSYRVVGFDSITKSGNVTITVVCTGNGSENAKVSFGGGGGVSCNGATSTQFHTNDSNQGRVQVSLSAGDGAYVNWTIVFSASN